jgi:hypothetical protein
MASFTNGAERTNSSIKWRHGNTIERSRTTVRPHGPEIGTLHLLLQAACRIGITWGTNVSQELQLYLITARRHGLAEKLADVSEGVE